MALSDEILADLAAKKKGGGGGPPPAKGPPMAAAAPAEEGDDSYGSDEESAMADFEDAATPAEKVAALKAFMAICYPQLASKGE